MPEPTKIIEAPPAAPDSACAAADGAVDAGGALARDLRLVSVLQTTLEFDVLLRLFSREIAGRVPHSSFGFVNAARGIDRRVGTAAAHRRAYTLVAGAETVGQVALTGERPLGRGERAELERQLCALAYPLLNALKYRDAVESAHTDFLTGLHNRAAMDRTMAREVALAQRHGTPLSLLIVDIDDFKHVNDRFGHVAGDQVLGGVAAVIAGCVRATDFVARYGGEEFTVLASTTDAAGARLLAERIRVTVEATPCRVNGVAVACTVSVGMGCLSHGEDAATLFERVDRAMYAAKHGGKNRVHVAG